MTISPAMTALVVAIAGMMLPAMAVEQSSDYIIMTNVGTVCSHLTSNLLFCWMWKTNALKLADATTKSIATLSSYGERTCHMGQTMPTVNA